MEVLLEICLRICLNCIKKWKVIFIFIWGKVNNRNKGEGNKSKDCLGKVKNKSVIFRWVVYV